MITEEQNISLESDNSDREQQFRQEAIDDFYIALVSREASLLGRREVLTGKAKFGILGDGKELPQIAMARAFKKGDWRSGYYRDQTFMMAIDECSIQDFFAQLYADADNDPFSGGRQMNSHFATPTIGADGNFLDVSDTYNISSDISCTGGQMARGLGLALATKKYNTIEGLEQASKFSAKGQEVVFCTIGDSSTSEGPFWESLNAAAVNQVPMITVVWDDGYGISVPVEKQTVKGSISRALEGFLVEEDDNGILIYTVKAWDYAALCYTFERVSALVRKESRPALIHVQECTQPQGHSTSGSHERYKSEERLAWEKEYDCIAQMEKWLLKNEILTQEDIDELRAKAKKHCREAKSEAWKRYYDPIKAKFNTLKEIYTSIAAPTSKVADLQKDLDGMITPFYGELLQNARRLKYALVADKVSIPESLNSFLTEAEEVGNDRYHTHLYSQSDKAAVKVPVVHPEFAEEKMLNGYQVLNKFFTEVMEIRKEVLAFGEDVGKIGDVNQGFAGLQEKFGEERVFDTGIREWSIMGMAIGTAMRGFRPIAEIQYLDYLLFGFSPLSDDLSTLRYRSNGLQAAPAIIRTRGHRLEGIWHAGSPLGVMINGLRGMHICVPRNMVQAAGMYNTLLQSDDPGIVIECLNGYRLKEKCPTNLLEFTVPLGQPEILQEGTDVTLVTYGSCVREAQKAIELLDSQVSVELIDVQTLLPFDMEHIIVESLKKTNRIIFLDEDVPGGATAYMMQQVLEVQKGYRYLDSQPKTLTAAPHRTPFGSDGDYFTKPNPENIYTTILDMATEAGLV